MPNRFSTIRVSPGGLFVLLLILIIGMPLFPEDQVEWQAVEGADHYVIEIRRDGELVLETRSSENSLPLFLPAGVYDFQIRVIDSFGKEGPSSEWKTLTLVAPSVPFAISLYPADIHEGADEDFLAKVSGFVAVSDEKEGSTFFLDSEDKKPITLEIIGTNENEGWTELTLSTGRTNPELGIWDLTMLNPDSLSSTIAGALEVLPNLKPRIRSVSPGKMDAGLTHNPLSVDISGLEEDAEIFFYGPTPIQPALIAQPEPGSLEYSLNLSEAEAGWYSIRVRNPSGGEAIKEKAFEVMPRPLSDEELTELNALKIDEKESLPLAEHPRALFFGWAVSIPIGETAGFYRTDYVGLTLGYSQSFQNDFFRKLYWLRGLSWDFTFGYTNHQTTYPILDIDLNRFHFLLGLNYVTPYDFPLNLLIKISSGIGISYFTSSEADRNEDLGGIKLSDLDSLDYVMRFGMGGRIDVSKRWFIDILCDVSATFYLSRSAWSVQPKLEGGWRW